MDGKTSLRYFDGATMKSYQMPSRAFEDNYCRQQDKPEECAEKVRFGNGCAHRDDANDIAAYKELPAISLLHHQATPLALVIFSPIVTSSCMFIDNVTYL
eukprot:scaffold34749_cov139-Skeletonema_marinoi.AAC.8